MKEDWDEPADERQCDVCLKNARRVVTKVPVRLDEVVYIQSGDNYSTSIEVPNGANGQRCKVVVEVPLKIVKDEGEDAKQERARAAVSRRINKRGSCHGKVVNADDGGKLGEHLTHVHCVKLDAVNCYLYVKQKKVLEALAKTQNGTRPPPKKDHGPFYPDQKCNFLKAAREIFSEEGRKQAFERELARFPQQEDADSDEEDEEDEEEEDEDEDDEEFIYVWKSTSFETFPRAKNEMFFRLTMMRALYRTKSQRQCPRAEAEFPITAH